MVHGTIVGSDLAQVVLLYDLFGQGESSTRIVTSPAGVATRHLLNLLSRGASSWTVDFTPDGQSKHVARWLRENFEGSVALARHSLGGKLMMRLALVYSGPVDRLPVVGTFPVPSDGPTGSAPLVAAIRSLDLEHLASRTEASRRLINVTLNPQVRGFLPQNLRRPGGDWMWKANLDLLGGSLRIIDGQSRMDAAYDGPA